MPPEPRPPRTFLRRVLEIAVVASFIAVLLVVVFQAIGQRVTQVFASTKSKLEVSEMVLPKSATRWTNSVVMPMAEERSDPPTNFYFAPVPPWPELDRDAAKRTGKSD